MRKHILQKPLMALAHAWHESRFAIDAPMSGVKTTANSPGRGQRKNTMATIKIDELNEMHQVSEQEAADVRGGAEETKKKKGGPSMMLVVQYQF